jgi:hypothetical protein
MEFLDISSLGGTYRYAFKIEKKLKKKNEKYFGYANPSQQKHDKGIPKSYNKGYIKDDQPQDNHSKP